MAETIFSKIINREIPADIVYEDDISLAFRDINPQAPVHLLIIPKKEIATINDIDREDRELVGHLYWVAGELAREMGELGQKAQNKKLKREDMMPGIGYVPGGVVELIERQRQGWAYIRP